MSTQQKILIDYIDDFVTITLNRPEVRNAFDNELIKELCKTLDELHTKPNLKALILKGADQQFCAGADLNWMKEIAKYTEEENYKDAMQLATLMHKLNNFKSPTICIAEGSAFGGAVGLISCCDIAIATKCKFALSEVKLGLAPAVISPYVVKAIGAQHARRYMLTGEVFDEVQALKIGLIHEISNEQDLDKNLKKILDNIKTSGKNAVQTTKMLISNVDARPINDELIDYTAKLIAKLRCQVEAQEGMSAFLEKRPTNW